MRNEEQPIIPECFQQFEKFPGAFFSDGKLIFTYYSGLLLFLQAIIGIILFFVFAYIVVKTGLARNGLMFGFFMAVYLLLDIIVSLQVNTFTVIDYTNNQLFKELCLFQKSLFTYGYVEIEDILQVSNNVIPYIINPEGKNNRVKVNDKSNLFHKYVVSFLVNNGDIVDFIELGAYDEYYEVSKNLAKAISQHWGIPLMVCGNNQRLYVRGEGERYHLAQVGIRYSYTRSVCISIFVLIVLSLFFFAYLGRIG